MAFQTPGLQDLIRSAENGLSVAFYGVSSTLRKTTLKVLARVFGGVTYLLLLFLQWMWKNVFVSTCDVEALLSFGADYGLPRKAAGYARGNVLMNGVSGAVVSQGTILIDSVSSAEYEVVSDVTMTGANMDVSVIAMQFGTSSNLDAGAVLEFRDGVIANVSESVVVSVGGLVGGINYEITVNGIVENWGETVEAYRKRLLYRRQNPPQGSAIQDYKIWATRFAAVTDCIVFPNYPKVNGVTCVLVRYDDSDNVELNEIEVAEVKDYLTADIRRPVTAEVIVSSCVAKSINLAVAITPNTSTVQDSVRAALRLALRAYVPGDTITIEKLTIAAKDSSAASNVSVTAIVGSGVSVKLSKENYEVGVLGDIMWSPL